MTDLFRLIAVSVGMLAPLGQWQGEAVMSGIRKTPVTLPIVRVGRTGIDGDGQADLTVHGGEHKAVYAYPSTHWGWWRDEARFSAGPAGFGENLTLDAGDENDLRIGDRFEWGPVELELSQPRGPCFKLGLMTGREDLPGRMTMSARTGWYFRVLKPGDAPVSGALLRTQSDPGSPTVREAFIAVYHPRVMSDVVERVLTCRTLSPDWRRGLERRLTARDPD